MVLPTNTCLRCGHTWVKRIEKPKFCPKCRSPYWDTPRIRKRRKETIKQGVETEIKKEKTIEEKEMPDKQVVIKTFKDIV